MSDLDIISDISYGIRNAVCPKKKEYLSSTGLNEFIEKEVADVVNRYNCPFPNKFYSKELGDIEILEYNRFSDRRHKNSDMCEVLINKASCKISKRFLREIYEDRNNVTEERQIRRVQKSLW